MAKNFKFLIKSDKPEIFTLSGRDGWALAQLIQAGDEGVTPITRPAPRWSAYVHKLRKRGIHIDTITEPHDGDFPGTHARYVLRSRVFAMSMGAFDAA